MASDHISLEELLELGINNNPKVIRDFYDNFLDSKVVIIDRYQNSPLSDSPSYPTPLVSVLGVKGKDNVFVPAFTREELVKEWSGLELSYREVSVQEALRLTPEGWWLVLNPGQEVEKEFSPWEIRLLAQGKQNLDLIVEELISSEESPSTTATPLNDNEYISLIEELRNIAKNSTEIDSIYVLKERSADNSETNNSLLVGIKANQNNISKEMVDKIKSSLNTSLIGDIPYKLFIRTNKEVDPMFGLFEVFTPIYKVEAPKGLLKRIFSIK